LYSMPIIYEYGTSHALANEDLLIWAKQIRSANWKDFNALKEDFPSCDYIEDERYVFNIHGNKYRLVAMIFFKSQQVFIRGIFTHAEYTKLSKKNKLGTL
jgi:mRNA interferase HigB